MEQTYDEEQLRFAHPFSMQLEGNRRTGKTHFTKTLLLKNRELIAPQLDVILWLYGTP